MVYCPEQKKRSMKRYPQKLSITIVIPLFNEQDSVSYLFRALNKVLKIISYPVTVIFVNDGSTDTTETELLKTKLDCKKQVITLSRNYGHQAALLAGLVAAKGDIVISMDGDLQHPPELIPLMIKLHQNGHDVVLTSRTNTDNISFIKKFTSQLFYKVINSLSETPIMANGSDFRSLNRKALNALLSLPESRKFLRGMVSWIGFKTITIPFKAKTRIASTSKYTTLKMVKLGFQGITSFSTFPLYLSGFFSGVLFFLAFVYGVYVLVAKYFLQITVEGWTSVILVLLCIGGILSLFMGLFGFYLAAIYEEVKRRPNYIIESEHA
jgi:dolichol-phosphate mannosyltransferase